MNATRNATNCSNGRKMPFQISVFSPSVGIVHQVNLEYLASVASTRMTDKGRVVLPDTLVGTDSHTTMINGIGVLGWGVGGIEAEGLHAGTAVIFPFAGYHRL